MPLGHYDNENVKSLFIAVEGPKAYFKKGRENNIYTCRENNQTNKKLDFLYCATISQNSSQVDAGCCPTSPINSDLIY